MITVILICFLIPYSGHAEEVYSLKEVIDLALKNNHYIKSKNYSVYAADKDLSSAESNFYPKLLLEEKFTTGDYTSYSVFTKLNQETLSAASFLKPGTATNFQTSITLEMPVYVKELFLLKDMKKLSLFSTTKEFERFKEEIAFKVFKAYLGVIKSKAYKAVTEKALEESKEVFRVTKVRAETGTGLKSDELRAFVFQKEREATLIKAENDVKVAKRMLGLLLADENPVDVIDDVTKLHIELPDIKDVLELAYENRKDLIAQTFNVENAQKFYEMQKSRFYPKVFFSGSYYNDGKSVPLGSDGNGYVIGVALKWELFDKTRNDDASRTRFEALKSKEFLAQLKKEIKFNVEVSYLKVEEAKKRLEVAKETVNEAEETFRLIKLRYDNNLSTIVELLDAEFSLISARTNLIISENEYFESLGNALFEAGVFLKHFND